MRRALATLIASALAIPALLVSVPAWAATCSTVPIGAINTAEDPEPQAPIWCVVLGAPAPVTLQLDGFGGFIDTMANGASGNAPAELNQTAYRVQDSISAGGISQSRHWTMNGYFGSDIAKTANFNGSDLSPNQTVTFQNGKLVLEADVAASIPGFSESNGADVVWTEVVASTRQTLDSSNTNDALYSYGYYRGGWAFGCRIQAHRSLTCAVEADHDLASTTGDQFPCYSVPPARMIEMSGHQQCGPVHSGFAADFGAPSNAFRTCPAGTVDPCLDRFRFEWAKTGFVAYVNGFKFAEDSGWPAQAQLPDALVNGSTPLYMHMADWGDFSDSNVYRFHWGRFAANPHNPDGTLMGPSASPTFGQPPPSPSPTPTPSSSPTASPSPSPTSFACNLRYGGTGHPGTCLRNSDGTVLFRPS